MFICDYNLCTGCSACANSCNSGAIEMKENEKGFLYPAINETKCVSCGICQRICPQNSSIKKYDVGDFYAAFAKKHKLRREGSSGSVFSVLAEHILSLKGVVFGAAFCEEMKVRHVFVENINELSKLRGSKYVQSEIGNVYREAKDFLTAGRYVLFSGTPCQVDGLICFLGSKTDKSKLLTVDVLCHGVPSPGVFKKFIEFTEATSGKKISLVNFRDKNPGWKQFAMKIEYTDNSSDSRETEYMNAFLKNIFLRESCYKCKYTSGERVADITLGDYWGYCEGKKHIEDDDHGISAVAVNTSKGKMFFKAVQKKLIYELRTYEDVKKGNPVLYRSSERSEQYYDFWKDYKSCDWQLLSDKYFSPNKEIIDLYTEKERKYLKLPYRIRHMRRWMRVFLDIIKRKITGTG